MHTFYSVYNIIIIIIIIQYHSVRTCQNYYTCTFLCATLLAMYTVRDLLVNR